MLFRSNVIDGRPRESRTELVRLFLLRSVGKNPSNVVSLTARAFGLSRQAVNRQVEVRPMMYVALSYDHRIIDGQQAVLYLVRVKELMEDPASMLID